jgi:uncharacterized protein (TIGR00369 family)
MQEPVADESPDRIRIASGYGLCSGCSPRGACRLGLTAERLEDGLVTFDLACPADHEGGPGVAHGGWTAAAFDEILGHVVQLHGRFSVTATLTVNFAKPVPVGLPLIARARVDRLEGRKWFLSGELLLASSDAVLATATGLWIERRHADHFEGFGTWLADQAPPAPGD